MNKTEMIEFISVSGFDGFADMEIQNRKIMVYLKSSQKPFLIQTIYPDSKHVYAKGLIPQEGEAAVMDKGLESEHILITTQYRYDKKDWAKEIKIWKNGDGQILMTIYQEHFKVAFEDNEDIVKASKEYEDYVAVKDDTWASQMAASYYEIRQVEVPTEDDVDAIVVPINDDEGVGLMAEIQAVGGAEVVKVMWWVGSDDVAGIDDNQVPQASDFGTKVYLETDFTIRKKNTLYVMSPKVSGKCVVQWKNSIGVVRNEHIEFTHDFTDSLGTIDYFGLVEASGFVEEDIQGLP